MIRLISGMTQIAGTIITPASGPFTLVPHDEQRFVEAGVAEYVRDATGKAVATPSVTPPVLGQGDTLPGVEGPESGGDCPYYDVSMKPDELRALMKEHGLQAKVGMSKADMVAALDALFKADEGDPGGDNPVEDGEELNLAGAEGPVV